MSPEKAQAWLKVLESPRLKLLLEGASKTRQEIEERVIRDHLSKGGPATPTTPTSGSTCGGVG